MRENDNVNRRCWFVDLDTYDKCENEICGDLGWELDTIDDTYNMSIDLCKIDIRRYLLEEGEYFEDCIPILSIFGGEWDCNNEEWIVPSVHDRIVEYRIAYCTSEEGDLYGIEADEYFLDDNKITNNNN